MVLHLAISLISSSLIHLVDFLGPLINCYFLRLNLILRLMVAGLLLLLHPLFGIHTVPFELRSCNSLPSFESKLKTWLFKVSYDVVF